MIKKYFRQIRNLKQALNRGLVFEKVYRVIININTELMKKAKTDFEKEFFKLMRY